MKDEAICAECHQTVSREDIIRYGNSVICAACKPIFLQRLREGATLPTMETQFVFVGFWIRFWAGIIDATLWMIIAYPILIAVYGRGYLNTSGFIAGPVDLFVSWILPAICTVGFWMRKQATPGKMLVNARIVDAYTGERPSMAQFIVRYIMYFLAALPLGMGILWVAFDKKKQGWHDKLARTVVIRLTKRAS